MTALLWLVFAVLVVWWSEKRYQRRKRKRLALHRILGKS